MLDALWERLGIGPALRSLLQDGQLAQPAERVLFALTANRALAPSPMLSVARWVSDDVLISGLETTNDGACYQAMDWLLQVREPLEKEVLDRAVAVLSIEVRPVGRRAAEQTRADVIMCWLALLLVRVAESAAGVTWRELRRQLDKIAVGTFTGPAGTFRQCTEISQAQRGILGRLGVDPPQTIYQLTPAAGALTFRYTPHRGSPPGRRGRTGAGPRDLGHPSWPANARVFRPRAGGSSRHERASQQRGADRSRASAHSR